ncbi:MAG: DUF3179 domain-containing (seleno)protein [Isosphaeraceae bacterium]|nr:DUF3179 domain-containing (seleno)protein [Isosphaeraceae bacterium]
MRKPIHTVSLLATAALAIGGVIVASVYWAERTVLWTSRNGYRSSRPTDHTWYPYSLPGVECPPAVPARDVTLDGDEEVIGVETGGRTRAYRLDALKDRRRHVVNDLVGGIPVSVVYCDLSDCVRVYTEPAGSRPLAVGLGGLFDGEMVVKLNGTLYLHKTGTPLKPGSHPATLPYETLTPARVTWKEWVGRHPGTDVYVGNAANEPAPPRPGVPGTSSALRQSGP